ncbi:hypothetical protein V8G54_018189 [Vigna mungo]|uniref:Uncharacterized protein n=1 Tax=Vigna mungo TaxID=3915 RepID=A0AAQ3NA33_VIGMU
MRNSGIPSNHPNFPLSWGPIIKRNLNSKSIPQMCSQLESIRITSNPQTNRQTNHNHASTHMCRTPETSTPCLCQHLPHLHNSLVIPLLDPLNTPFKPVNKLHRSRNNQLCTIIPGPNPSTLHSQAIAILMRHHRVM